MSSQLACTIATASFVALSIGSVLAAERVGFKNEVQSTVTRQGAAGKRVIARADPIYQDERLPSNLTGVGQFQLSDGTKVVLSRNASLGYGLGGVGNARSITLKLLSGSARFVTGASNKRVYRILTPQGTLGLRGTAFELTVKNGKTYILRLSKLH
jgi:hypothetical protein